MLNIVCIYIEKYFEVLCRRPSWCSCSNYHALQVHWSVSGFLKAKKTVTDKFAFTDISHLETGLTPPFYDPFTFFLLSSKRAYRSLLNIFTRLFSPGVGSSVEFWIGTLDCVNSLIMVAWNRCFSPFYLTQMPFSHLYTRMCILCPSRSILCKLGVHPQV